MIRVKQFIRKNLSFTFLYIFIAYTFYNFLYYQLEHVDEVNYLSDSLLLFEGILPSFKHSPSGLSTWLGSFYVFFEFIVYSALNNVPTDIKTLLGNFDYIIFLNYLDLTSIKSTLFLLNLFLIFYFYINDKENKNFFYLFIIIFFSPFLINLTFSGKPYFTASLFCALSFALKNKNIRISHIFYALAIAEKLEFILLINFFINENNKFHLKSYFFIFVVFIAVAPWWTASFFQNIKINLNYILDNSLISGDNNQSLLNSIVFFFYFFGLFFLFLFKKKIFQLAAITFLFLSILHLLLYQNYYLRWFQPYFVYLAFYISSTNIFLQMNKKVNNIIFIIPIIFLSLLYTSKKNSDLEILTIEKNSLSDNILSYGLLKEDLDFKDYIEQQIPNFNKRNIKNINHFDDPNAPLSFSVSGNLEINFIRRYEYLAKYHNGIKNKFILMGGGIPSDIRFWCQNSNMGDETQIISFNNQKVIRNCLKFK